MLEIAIVATGIVGVVVGFAVARPLREREKRRLAAGALEEGFRSFIEHHVEEMDRDGETADKLWQQTVSKRQAEAAARAFAEQRSE